METPPLNAGEELRAETRVLPDFQIQAILDEREAMMQRKEHPTTEQYIRIQTAAIERLKRLEEGNYHPEIVPDSK